MGKIWGLPSIQSVKSFEDLRRFTNQSVTSITDVLTNNINFSDNFRGQIFTVGPLSQMQWANPGPTSFRLSMNVIPTGYLVLSQNAAGQVFQDLTYPATQGQIALSTSAPTTTYTIIILG
jgi:hypothetical protein